MASRGAEGWRVRISGLYFAAGTAGVSGLSSPGLDRCRARHRRSLSSGRRLKLVLATMVLSLAANAWSAGDPATALRRLGRGGRRRGWPLVLPLAAPAVTPARRGSSALR